MLYTVVVVLLILWLLGFLGHVGGAFVHALIVVAAVLFIFEFFSNRRNRL